MVKVLYIAGYSRCGSTILDMVLNDHPEIVSTGELTFLLEDAADSTRTCTCGAPYRACSLYGDWLSGRPTGEAKLVRRIERRSHFSALVAGRVSPSDRIAYADYARSLMDHLHQRTSASIVVDSSKSARDASGRPLAMLRLAGLDVRILHLSRDPGDTLRSYLDSGSNWVLEGRRDPRVLDSFRPIVGWRLANGIALRLGEELGQERYMHMRFEDFRADPQAALARIGDFVDMDLSLSSERITQGKEFFATHSVGGNRTRRHPQPVKNGGSNQTRLPAAYNLLLSILTGKAAQRLGYR